MTLGAFQEWTLTGEEARLLSENLEEFVQQKMGEGDAASKAAALSRESDTVVAGSSPGSPSPILCVCGHEHISGTRGSCSSFLCECRVFRAANSQAGPR